MNSTTDLLSELHRELQEQYPNTFTAINRMVYGTGSGKQNTAFVVGIGSARYKFNHIGDVIRYIREDTLFYSDVMGGENEDIL